MQSAAGTSNVTGLPRPVNATTSTVPHPSRVVNRYSAITCPVCSFTVPREAETSARPAALPRSANWTRQTTVRRARALSDRLFREAKRFPEYKQALATKESHDAFNVRLHRISSYINAASSEPLPDGQLREVVRRIANRVATWEHSPEKQRARQAKQAASRRRKNRGRDLQILRLSEQHISNSGLRTCLIWMNYCTGHAQGRIVRHLRLRDSP